jgi:DNA-binding transcriptional regulator GbsR (MarR family)
MSDQQQPGDAAEPVDTEQLLLCIPDESSKGLSLSEIRDAYADEQTGLSKADFDAAIRKLETEGHVRTTTRRIFGTRVQFYRRSSR